MCSWPVLSLSSRHFAWLNCAVIHSCWPGKWASLSVWFAIHTTLLPISPCTHASPMRRLIFMPSAFCEYQAAKASTLLSKCEWVCALGYGHAHKYQAAKVDQCSSNKKQNTAAAMLLNVVIIGLAVAHKNILEGGSIHFYSFQSYLLVDRKLKFCNVCQILLWPWTKFWYPSFLSAVWPLKLYWRHFAWLGYK